MTNFIVTETKNGSGSIKSAYRCINNEDFISRISELAMRSDVEIKTVDDACDYLDDKYAQKTEIVTEADFKERDPSDWEQVVLAQAEVLGWYSEPVFD